MGCLGSFKWPTCLWSNTFLNQMGQHLHYPFIGSSKRSSQSGCVCGAPIHSSFSKCTVSKPGSLVIQIQNDHIWHVGLRLHLKIHHLPILTLLHALYQTHEWFKASTWLYLQTDVHETLMEVLMNFCLSFSQLLKALQKLQDLDVSLDILSVRFVTTMTTIVAPGLIGFDLYLLTLYLQSNSWQETGIGKTVNSLRKHKEVGEVAKSLVKYWKKLVPKGSARCCLTVFSVLHLMFCILRFLCEIWLSNLSFLKHSNPLEESKSKQSGHHDDVHGSRYSKDKPAPKEQTHRISDTEKACKDKESNRKCPKPKLTPEVHLPHPLPSRAEAKYSKTLPDSASEKEDATETLKSCQLSKSKKKKVVEKKESSMKIKNKSENDRPSNASIKKAKTKLNTSSGPDLEDSSMSFESYLSYDANALKRKARTASKQPPKKSKILEKGEAPKQQVVKSIKGPLLSGNGISTNKVSLSDLVLGQFQTYHECTHRRFKYPDCCWRVKTNITLFPSG